VTGNETASIIVPMLTSIATTTWGLWKIGRARWAVEANGANDFAYSGNSVQSAVFDERGVSFTTKMGGKEPPPYPLLENYIQNYRESWMQSMSAEDVTGLIQQIEGYRGAVGQRYRVLVQNIGVLDASSNGATMIISTQTRKWVLLEEWYHSRGKLERFLSEDIEGIVKTLPTKKFPPAFTGKFPVKIRRTDAAQEIAVKEYILRNHADLLSEADRAFLESQVQVLRSWGTLYGY